MVGFAYNNAKYASIGYMLFELICRYYPHVFYKKNVDPHSKSKAANELIKELMNLIAAWKENL